MEPSDQTIPASSAIVQTWNLIAPFIHHTAILSCETFNTLFSAKLFFKCENFQKAGAFKFRGATNAVQRISQQALSSGVATHSSGNHAQALALAARQRGLKAYIVMPGNAPAVKVAAVRSYGGQISFCEPTLQAREAVLDEVVSQTGATVVHPYNDYHVIAGQATAAAELIEDAGRLDCIMAPLGGGGLLSGSILSARYFSPHIKVYGAEPLNANDGWQSFKSEKWIPSVNPQTIADGLKTSLGTLTWPIIQKGAEDIFTASEASIVQAMRLIWERMKIVVEPSAAVPLAAMLEKKDFFRGKRIGIILSGGNVDVGNLPF